jgi:type I restriction enzyme S subunit
MTEFPELMLVRGDIVMALNRPIIGDQLKVARITESDHPAILYQRVGRLKPVLEETSLYFFYVAQSELMLKAVRRRLQGTDQPYLNTSLVPDIIIPLPPLAEQNRIVAEVERRFSVIEEVEAVVVANLKRAEGLRRSVLHHAFIGNL